MAHIVSHVLATMGGQATDLYSELSPLLGVARTNYTELQGDLATMARECQAALAFVSSSQGREAGGAVVRGFLEEARGRIVVLQGAERKMARRWASCLVGPVCWLNCAFVMLQ